jgi:hypothetical protein
MSLSRMIKIAGAFLFALLLVAGLALAWVRWAPRNVPEGQPDLVVVRAGSIDPVREAFNRGAGEIRVLALFSPT